MYLQVRRRWIIRKKEKRGRGEEGKGLGGKRGARKPVAQETIGLFLPSFCVLGLGGEGVVGAYTDYNLSTSWRLRGYQEVWGRVEKGWQNQKARSLKGTVNYYLFIFYDGYQS